jgi:hypothetical protein
MLIWVLAPCRLVSRCQRFGETSCLHLRWQLPMSLHGAKTQKINIIILTALKTSGLFLLLCTAITV